MSSKISSALEQRWTRWVREGKMRPVLSVLAGGYGLVTTLRNRAYDVGTFRKHRASIPVVSVGNLSLGGSGKTPLVRLLVEWLQPHCRVAVVSRGYGGDVEKARDPVVLSRGDGPTLAPSFVGDEPYLLAQGHPGLIVVVGPDRVAGARLAADAGADVVLLDDGLQHRRLDRDLDLVVWDGEMVSEELHLFPRGRLRESIVALGRADFLFVDQEAELPPQISQYFPHTVIRTRLRPVKVHGTESLPEQWEDQPVALFCGIGRPKRFVQTVAQLGARVVAEWHLPDHAAPSPGELANMVQRSRELGACALLCTEKDWVKLPMISQSSIPLGWVEISLEVMEGENLLREQLRKLLTE